MIWIAPSEKDTATEAIEKRLWDAADQFRANPGLIFLRLAEVRFAAQRAKPSLNAVARELETAIASNVAEILEG